MPVREGGDNRGGEQVKKKIAIWAAPSIPSATRPSTVVDWRSVLFGSAVLLLLIAAAEVQRMRTVRTGVQADRFAQTMPQASRVDVMATALFDFLV